MEAGQDLHPKVLSWHDGQVSSVGITENGDITICSGGRCVVMMAADWVKATWGNPTITDLVTTVFAVNVANGWHEDKGETLTRDHPLAQIAGLTALNQEITALIECIRKDGNAVSRSVLTQAILRQARILSEGVRQRADDLFFLTEERHKPAHGSKTEAIARLRLIDTETVEATEAVLNGDTANLAEELADIVIRVLDFVGGWNATRPADRQIDLQAAILAKIEKNKARGYRHGGKLA